MNVSMSEIVVILLIALLVIKPEQLPDVAYALGRFAAGLRRFFGKVKEEINTFTAISEPDEQKREQTK